MYKRTHIVHCPARVQDKQNRDCIVLPNIFLGGTIYIFYRCGRVEQIVPLELL